jgi:hypothetical protein
MSEREFSSGIKMSEREFCSGIKMSEREFCSGIKMSEREFCSGIKMSEREFCSGIKMSFVEAIKRISFVETQTSQQSDNVKQPAVILVLQYWYTILVIPVSSSICNTGTDTGKY